MEIKIENLAKLTAEADKIFLEPDGEETLIKLLDIQKQVEHAIDTAKQMLEKKALELNPNFSSIQADKIKVYYRSYGARYRVDENDLDKLNSAFYKIRKTYDVITEEVEKYTEEHKGMPIGIQEIERPKSLSFSLKNKTEND
jgi:type III secretory pathway component EscV